MSLSVADCRRLLDEALASGDTRPARVAALAGTPGDVLDAALAGFAAEHGAAAQPLLFGLSTAADRALRRAAKRALYRLEQRGVARPAAPTPRPVVARQVERVTRAWVSGIDGSGSRAAWLLFEGAYGGLQLCSLILSDTSGIVDVAGGEITKKRLAAELASLRAEQKLPWVEMAPDTVVGLVAEALALHSANGTAPAPAFARWQRLFQRAPRAALPPLPPAGDPALVERSPEIFELPELAGWFLDPEALQSDAVDLLQSRESRLVVSDQIKEERERAIVNRVVERELTLPARRRWARRLTEMATVFRAIGRPGHAELAEAAAGAFAEEAYDPTRHPFALGLARRGLELAGEVALGRVSMADVSRKPAPIAAAAEPPRA